MLETTAHFTFDPGSDGMQNLQLRRRATRPELTDAASFEAGCPECLLRGDVEQAQTATDVSRRSPSDLGLGVV